MGMQAIYKDDIDRNQILMEVEPKDYSDGRTKQTFKDETDVNLIIQKHARLGTLSHLERYSGVYGDFAGFDFQEAQNQIAAANSMFEQLPANTRNKFKNSPAAFLNFVNHPDNRDDLAEKLPELAAQGYRDRNMNPSADNPPDDDPPAPDDPSGDD